MRKIESQPTPDKPSSDLLPFEQPVRTEFFTSLTDLRDDLLELEQLLLAASEVQGVVAGDHKCLSAVIQAGIRETGRIEDRLTSLLSCCAPTREGGI